MAEPDWLRKARKKGLTITEGPPVDLGTPEALDAASRVRGAGPPRVSNSERVFQTWVIKLAQSNGWLVAHFRPMQDARGRWRTPVQADGAGFPDLVLLRASEAIAAELKVNWNKPSIEQWRWLSAFGAAGVESAVWKPADWEKIAERLTRPRPNPATL